ncbi:MAG: MFS transporter [Caldisericia bacterium]|nr:MFS transporter [Caldisericia bacterium]
MVSDSAYFIQKNARWNFFINSSNAAFYTLAMSFASIITLLPLYIEKLGGTNLQIGLIPAMAFLGYQIPGLFTANYIESLSNKLAFVKKITPMERIPFYILTISTLYVGILHSQISICIVLFCLIMITFVSGAITPAWLAYIIKVIPPVKLGSYFSMGSGIGGLMGIGASLMATYILKTKPFPENFKWIFFYASIAVTLSWLCTLFGREPPIVSVHEKRSPWQYFSSLPEVIRQDSNFFFYILMRNFLCLGSMATTFFTVYGIRRLNMPDQYAGIFAICLLASQSFFFFLWGYIGDKFSHKLVICLGAFALTLSSFIAILFPTIVSLYFVYACMGMYYSSQGSSGLAIVNIWAPEGKYPTYISLTNGLTAISAFIAPLIGGKIADSIGFHPLFWLAGGLSLIGFILMIALVKESRSKIIAET